MMTSMSKKMAAAVLAVTRASEKKRGCGCFGRYRSNVSERMFQLVQTRS